MEFFTETASQVLDNLKLLGYLTYPIILPLFFLYGFWKMWVTFVRAKFIAATETQILEIRVPREITRTPLAMELVLNALYQTGGESTWYDRYILGKVRSWFSLELVSIGGEVRFFIWTPARWKNLIESQLYAEYPGIEILESTDYSELVQFDESKMDYWGTELVFNKPSYIPLKTYVDYGMDKPGIKEEHQIDPLMPTIEFMSTLSSKEQMWIQIVVRAHKGDRKPGAYFPWQIEKWQDKGKEFIKKTSAPEPVKVGEAAIPAPISESDIELIKAVNRNIDKYGFDTGIRALYIAEKEAFDGTNIPGMLGSYRQFGSNNLNSLRPNNVTDFDFPWTKRFRKKRLSEMKKNMLEAYKRRMFFHAPFIRKSQVMNTEQLATLYHFPSGIVETPAFSRVQSKKADPPTNLPV